MKVYPDQIPEGFKRGGFKPIKYTREQYIQITDGAVNRQILINEPIPDGFHRGMTKIISPETKQKLKEQRSKNAKGRIWVTNGKISKFVLPNEIPNGFYPGRMPFKRKRN